MKIHNLYADDGGESHFRDVEIEWIENGRDGQLSRRTEAKSITFRATPADYLNGWHTSPRRQYVVNLDAPVHLMASDGESRIIGIGEVILLEDLHGKGHKGGAVDGKFRHSVIVAID